IVWWARQLNPPYRYLSVAAAGTGAAARCAAGIDRRAVEVELFFRRERFDRLGLHLLGGCLGNNRQGNKGGKADPREHRHVMVLLLGMSKARLYRMRLTRRLRRLD